jgi:hypothetical protein
LLTLSRWDAIFTVDLLVIVRKFRLSAFVRTGQVQRRKLLVCEFVWEGKGQTRSDALLSRFNLCLVLKHPQQRLAHAWFGR